MKLLPFLSEIIYRESCESKLPLDCINSIGAYVRQDLSTEKGLDEKTLREKIEAYIQNRMNTPIDSVLVKENCDEVTIENIGRINDNALFFVVNNLYVNPNKVTNAPILANQLTAIVNMPKDTLESLFVIKKRRHLEILRKMSINTRDIIKKRIEQEKAVLQTITNKDKAREIWTAENAIFPFIKIEDNLMRYYPE